MEYENGFILTSGTNLLKTTTLTNSISGTNLLDSSIMGSGIIWMSQPPHPSTISTENEDQIQEEKIEPLKLKDTRLTDWLERD